jgi:hypothetical protein
MFIPEASEISIGAGKFTLVLLEFGEGEANKKRVDRNEEMSDIEEVFLYASGLMLRIYEAKYVSICLNGK